MIAAMSAVPRAFTPDYESIKYSSQDKQVAAIKLGEYWIKEPF